MICCEVHSTNPPASVTNPMSVYFRPSLRPRSIVASMKGCVDRGAGRKGVRPGRQAGLTSRTFGHTVQMVLKATDVPADAAKPYAFSTFMNTAAAVAELRETATVDRVVMRPAQRLADIHALFAEEMGWVDAELRLLAATGVTPATDSARHLLEAGGKRVRPLAVLLAAGCFGEIPEAARHVAAVSELIHLATLLHDDVIDDAPVRRGKPTARTLWGNAVSVLAGALLLTHALERTSRVAPGSVLVELFATLRKLVDGEVVQLRGRTKIDVRPATYFAIVRD